MITNMVSWNAMLCNVVDVCGTTLSLTTMAEDNDEVRKDSQLPLREKKCPAYNYVWFIRIIRVLTAKWCRCHLSSCHMFLIHRNLACCRQMSHWQTDRICSSAQHSWNKFVFFRFHCIMLRLVFCRPLPVFWDVGLGEIKSRWYLYLCMCNFIRNYLQCRIDNLIAESVKPAMLCVTPHSS
jgi:hypothetical protein